MNVVSLFANIGIGDAYLKSIKFNIVVANELEPRRVEIYRQIYPDTNMICGDITDKKVYSSIRKACEKKIDIVMATPPCQGMSSAGKQDEFDVRNELFLSAVQLIKDLKPDYFIFENVPRFMTTYIKYNDEKRLIPDSRIRFPRRPLVPPSAPPSAKTYPSSSRTPILSSRSIR